MDLTAGDKGPVEPREGPVEPEGGLVEPAGRLVKPEEGPVEPLGRQASGIVHAPAGGSGVAPILDRVPNGVHVHVLRSR